MKRILTTPMQYEDIASLRLGDVVYLSGILATGRDDVYRRIVKEGKQCPGALHPFGFSGLPIFHAGPIVRISTSDGTHPLKKPEYKVISIGPTTSMRMEAWAEEFIRKTGVKMMIGKGGMGDKTAAACREYGVIHCVYPGGCAVLGAGQVEKVIDVYWRKLGMPEALWIMQVHKFGPLIVSIDTKGNNMFAENTALYASNKAACMKPVTDWLENN
jgi:L(+)-tartrate dehydratase beta subunit